MSSIFNPIRTQLSASGEHAPHLLIEPVMVSNFGSGGKPGAGIYQVFPEDHSEQLGRFVFEGSQWHYEGDRLNEFEQEELAFVIWSQQR